MGIRPRTATLVRRGAGNSRASKGQSFQSLRSQGEVLTVITKTGCYLFCSCFSKLILYNFQAVELPIKFSSHKCCLMNKSTVQIMSFNGTTNLL